MLFVAVLTMGSAGTTLFAQKCVQSSSGSIASMIGTDFDYDNDLEEKGVSYKDPREMHYSYTTALSGVRLLPDYGMVSGSKPYPFGSNYGVDVKYNATDVPNGTFSDIKDSYFITDNLWKMYGSRPYAVAPRDNGNSYLVFHNISDGGMSIASIYLPYQTYKGRAAKVQVRFYVGNIGIADTQEGGSEVSNYIRYDGSVPAVIKKNIKDNNYPNFSTAAYEGKVGNKYGLDYVQHGPDMWNDLIYNTQTTKQKSHSPQLRLGIGNGSGSNTNATYKYYGDEYYDLTPVSGTRVGTGNPAYVIINEASNNGSTINGQNGQWYGWYEGELELNSAFYGGTGGVGTNNFFNIRVESQNVSKYDFIAIDYINVKTAHICADMDKYCPNQPVTFTAHNYADGVVIDWQQMVSFIMDDYAKVTYPAIYNKLLGSTNQVWKTVGFEGKEESKVIAHGDTVIIKGYGEDKNASWFTFLSTADRTVQVIPSREVYENSYSLAFRAIDKSAERPESFEVWLRPDLNCFNNVGGGIKGPDMVCMNDTPEYWAVMDDGSEIDKNISVKWFLQYVGKENDDAMNAKLNGLLDDAVAGSSCGDGGVTLVRDGKMYCSPAGFGAKDNNHATFIRFDYNQLEEGVYRLGYYQSAKAYEYDPKHPNDPTYATIVEKPLNNGEPVVTYIRAFRSPNGTATLVSGMTQNGSNYQVCAADISNEVVVSLQDQSHYLHNADDYNKIASKEGLTQFEKYPEYWVRYFPYGEQIIKTSDGDVLNTSDPRHYVIVPGNHYGVSNPVEVSQKIKGLCDETKFTIGSEAKIIAINNNGSLVQWYNMSESYCKGGLGKIDAEVKKPEMKLICDNISTQNRVFIAGPTTKDTSIVLDVNRIPQLGSDVCDSDPTVTITYSDAEGNSVVETVKYSVIKAKKFKLPLLLGTNTVNYKFTDGCGQSAACDVIYEFKDVTPPNLDCDKIKGRVISVKLSEFTNINVADKKAYFTIDGVTSEESIPQQMVDGNKDLDCSVSFDHFTLIHNRPSPTYNNVCLTDLNGVDGYICPTYAGRWETDIDLFNENINDHINKFKNVSSWVEPYKIGHTYILWKYTDAAGNVSYCTQLIEVIDDLQPVMTGCVTTPITIGTELDKCELSYDALLDTIKFDIPTATEVCNTSKNLNLRYEYWITPDGGTAYQFTSSSAPLTKGKYTLQIRIYKANGTYVDQTVYASCEREIEVVDKQAPTFDCSYLTTINVDVNKDLRKDFNHIINKYIFDYASTLNGILDKPSASTHHFPGIGGAPLLPGNDVPKGRDLEASLEEYFKAGNEHYDPALVINKVKDNCGEEVDVMMTLKLAKAEMKELYTETDYVGKTGAELLDILRKTQFYEGVNYIIYTFTDDSGNKTVCQQEVVVASLPVFDPKCPDYGEKFYVGDDCVFELTAEYLHKIQPEAAKVMYDVINQFPVVMPGPPTPGSCFGHNGNEAETSYLEDAYPDSLVVVDGAGNKFKFVNSYAQAGEYAVVYTATCNGIDISYKPKEYANYTNAKFELDDFLGGATLAQGTATIIWYYASAGNQLGYCYATVDVVDTISPKIVCDVDDITMAALDYPQCVLPFKNSGVVMKTIGELSPSDNCTKGNENFTLTWTRSDGVTEFETDFAIGTTNIDYIVTDLAGNSTVCRQVVKVEDKSVYYDCNKLKSPISVLASASCDVPFIDVNELGLPSSISTKDCTDEGEIVAVPTRSDGKSLTDKFSKGQTTVTWTFTDELNNKFTCQQIINVEDKSEPEFDCDDITPNPLVYETSRVDECQPALEDVEKLFGTYEALDNCDGKITGTPWLMNGPKDSDRETLPTNFELNKTYIIGWVFVDASTNEKVCRQTLEIRDNVAPVPSNCPADYTFTPAVGVCEVTWSDLNLPIPSIPDDCEASITASKFKVEAWYGGEYVVYLTDDVKNKPETIKFAASTKEHLVHWIFVDKAGNESECVQKVFVNDVTPPVVDCDPNNIFGSGQKEYLFTVSDDNHDCELNAVDFNKIFYPPVAYDECEDLANGTDHAPIPVSKVTRTYYPTIEDYEANTNGELIVDNNGDADMTANYKKGVTVLHYEFKDASGNYSVSCDLPIKVVDKSAPYFDCATIDPDTILAVAKTTDCEEALADVDAGPYYAYDWCMTDENGDPLQIQGFLHFDKLSASQVADTFKFKVGEVYDLYWIFKDEDNNKRICPQTIEVKSDLDLDLDCDKYKSYSALAVKDECYAPFESLNMDTIPFAIDKCVPEDTVWGVPTRSDGLGLKDNYPTGITTITWAFKSVHSVKDSVYCTSTVTIYGNKPFAEMDCDKLFPPILKLTDDCGPTDIELISQKADDPCVDGYEAWAVPSVKDADTKKYADVAKNAEDKYIHSFQLGIDTVKWTFSDFTDTIHAYCYQKVELLTTKPMVGDCPEALGDVTIELPDGQCEAVPDANQMLALTEGKWTKENPCVKDDQGNPIIIKGVPSRADGKKLTDPYRFSTTITWTFTDTTKTMRDSVTTCTTKVFVGDVAELINCDRDFPRIDTVVKGTCEYSYANVNKIPYPLDPCSGQPAVVGMEYFKNDDVAPVAKYTGKTDIENFLKTNKFLPGVYRFHWEYVFTDNENNENTVSCDQLMQIKSDKAPVVDCSAKNDTIVLPETVCNIDKDQVLDSIVAPTGKDACTGDPIIGVPELKTMVDGNAVYSALPSKFKVGEPYTIIWVFKNDSLSISADTCEKKLIIMGSSKPLFNCSFYDNIIEVSAEDNCDVNVDDQILPIPVGKDACVDTAKVYAKGYEVDTVAGKPVYTLLAEMNNGTPSYKVSTLTVGIHKIAWVFESKYSVAKDTCVETMDVLTDKKMDIDCRTLDPIDPTSDDSCSAVVRLQEPMAVNLCTGGVILPDTVIRSDNKVFTGVNDTFYVGTTTVYWIFVDHSKTLKDSIDTCIQVVQVGDVKEAPIQCPDSLTFTLPGNVCEATPASLGIDATKPEFVDFCAGTVIPVQKAYRTSGLPLTANYHLGVDTIVREYMYHGTLITCEQKVVVRNASLDSFDCKMLGTEDTIVVELKTAINTVPFSEVLANGFKMPVILNECNNLDTTFIRSDNLSLEDPYPLGETKITFIIKDITKGSERQKICERIVKVINTAAPTMDCGEPDLTIYTCFTDIPEPYRTVSDFVNKGHGSFTALGGDAKDLVNPSSFRVDSVIYDVNGNETKRIDLCEFTMVRTYSALDLRGQKITPCTDTIRFKDTVPPVWNGGVASNIEPLACASEVQFVEQLSAVDECRNETFTTATEKHSESVLKSGIFYTVTSTRKNDPSICDYYNFDIARHYVAYDACGNKSDTITYKKEVRDQNPPVVNIPKNWGDTVIMADYIKPCIFIVPDLYALFPFDSISDDCYPEAVKYFTHYQEPKVGTVLDPSKGNIKVSLFVKDTCGNKTQIDKEIYVPTKESIVSIEMHDDTVCVGDRLTIDHVRSYGGSCYYYNPNTDEWEYSASIAWFDYYKGGVDDDHMIYSTSTKNSWKFEGKSINECLALDSHSKSDTFYIVVTDTVRFCSDTAMANIVVNDVPWISLTPEVYNVCENDSIHLVSEDSMLYYKFDVKVDDMGDSISSEGWMLGDSIYKPLAKVPFSDTLISFRYYAVNGCGTGISSQSIGINTIQRMKPENLMLVTDPQDKPRVFMGEDASIKLVSKYRPYEYKWFKVNGVYDGRFEETFDRDGEVKEEYKDMIDEPDEFIISTFKEEKNYNKLDLPSLGDTASYYVLMIDSVCPAVPSNVVSINVVKEIPTAITPSNSAGYNDVFMEGYPVIIFNRYGQKIFEGNNGWDGTCRGEIVDPAVYFYEIVLRNGEKHKGSIEVVYFK